MLIGFISAEKNNKAYNAICVEYSIILNPKYKTIFHTTVTRAYPFQKKYIRDLIELRSQGLRTMQQVVFLVLNPVLDLRHEK